MQASVAFLVGLLFGLGLLLSGMANPAKVLGFLDLAGVWDPSLMLVMVGAIALAMGPFAWAKKHRVSLLGCPLSLPTATQIDRRLVVGSVLFGVGWGLTGFCPGPALVALGAGEIKALIFVVFMLLGMATFAVIENKRHIQGKV
jgi:uncharacterized protein